VTRRRRGIRRGEERMTEGVRMHPSNLRTTLLVAVVALAVVSLAPATAWAQPRDPIYRIDGTPTMGVLPAPFQMFESGIPTGPLAADLPTHDGRYPDLVLTLRDDSSSHPGPIQVPFWKEGSGAHSDVYIAWNDLTAPTEDPADDVITKAQIDYVSQEFDARIWASDVFHFGWYEPRVPADAPAGFDGSRAAIFVYNIRDDAYWDATFPWYTIGFFNSSVNDELGLNAIFVDSASWQYLVGPTAKYPYYIEATVAHEFQHLINNDVDPDEELFINEGKSMLAEQFLYDMETAKDYVQEYLTYHRDSLTDWKGELFDYGDSMMWMDYLWEQAGGGLFTTPVTARVAEGHDPFEDNADKFADSGDAFVWNLAHEQEKGMAGVAVLVGDMDEVKAMHRDWTLANLLDGKVAEPEWNYRNMALGGPDSNYTTIDDGIAYYRTGVNGNMPPTRKNVPRRTVTEPWGAYYRSYGGQEPGLTMTFTGPAKDGVLPHSLPKEWYSGLGNMLLRELVRKVDGVVAGDTLKVWTWYDIEEDWDYGYVQASSDGQDWTTLAQISTLPTGKSNLYDSHAWLGAGGFTGNSGGWQQAEFDLGSLSGTVYVRFLYATDEAANGQGWYVDDLAVGATQDAVASPDGWTTNGWLFTDGLQQNDWTADVFYPLARAKRKTYSVRPIVALDADQFSGSVSVPTQWQKSLKVYGIASNRPDGVFNSEGRLTILKGK
jgi:hypothetical protein